MLCYQQRVFFYTDLNNRFTTALYKAMAERSGHLAAALLGLLYSQGGNKAVCVGVHFFPVLFRSCKNRDYITNLIDTSFGFLLDKIRGQLAGEM